MSKISSSGYIALSAIKKGSSWAAILKELMSIVTVRESIDLFFLLSPSDALVTARFGAILLFILLFFNPEPIGSAIRV